MFFFLIFKGYMSEDGDPMDQNDNLSEFIVGDHTILKYLYRLKRKKKDNIKLNYLNQKNEKILFLSLCLVIHLCFNF